MTEPANTSHMPQRLSVRFISLCLLSFGLAITLHPLRATSDDACLSIGISPEIRLDQRAVETTLENTYQEADLCIKWVKAPIKRVEALLSQGLLDGEIVRTKDYIRTKNYLIAVDPPIEEAQGGFVTLASSEISCAHPQFKGRSIGYLFGTQWHLEELRSMGARSLPISQITKTPTLLERGRIDAFIFDLSTVKDIANDLNKRGVEARACPWSTMALHHVLHIRHADKKERLGNALQVVLDKNTPTHP